MSGDEARQLRLRVLRRAVFAANARGLLDERVPPEGPFDAALANGLAAIVASVEPGKELDAKGFVLAPLKMLDIVASEQGLDWIDVELLREGLSLSQPLRHGRAEDEWTRITSRHIDALLALDLHEALEAIPDAEDTTFDELVVTLYKHEMDERLPYGQDRLLVPDPENCPECGRVTLMADGWDLFGVGLDEGALCIACGYERSYEDVVDDAIRRAMDAPD